MKAFINGFPELLPEEQIIMNSRIEDSKKIFENYWYVSLETSVVENMDILLAKWSDDKEIYWVKRHSNTDEKAWNDKDTKMWLHFDLTIPFARYVTNHFNDLSFPFKRYQTQKCRRWERPQLWRYREFLQSDIDVVWNEELPLYFDAEVLEIAIKALNKIVPDQFEMFFNNRKIFDWLCNFYWLSDETKKQLIKTIDKLDKIWVESCIQELTNLNVPKELSEFLTSTNWIWLDIDEIKKMFSKYLDNDIIKEAVNEIEILIKNLDPSASKVIQLKLNLARWLDYYTWSIFEWRLIDYPWLSICWGWRYENLTNTIWNKKLPGVGISLWLSRMFWLLEHLKKIEINKKSNTRILIWWFSEVKRSTWNQIANTLRTNNINTEVYHNFEHKPTKQIKYAINKWINDIVFIWDDDTFDLKNLTTWEQINISIEKLIEMF